MDGFVSSDAAKATARVSSQISLSQDMARRANQGREEELEDRIERLALVCEAMWSLLRVTSGLTDDQLLERVHELDAADGTVDGKVQRTARRCGCGAMVNHRSKNCVYCGAEVGRFSPFG